MSDETLRSLERLAAADGGAAHARAALLRERLRQGALGRDRLELLAALGGQAAAEVLGVAAGRPPHRGELARFAGRLVRFGREPALRAAAALLARLWEEGLVADGVYDDDDPDARLLGVLGAAIDCPCPRHRAALAAPSRELGEWLEEGYDVGALEPGDYLVLASEAALAACEAARASDDAAVERAVARSVERAARCLAALGALQRFGGNAADAAWGAKLADPELPGRTVVAALRAWALAPAVPRA